MQSCLENYNEAEVMENLRTQLIAYMRELLTPMHCDMHATAVQPAVWCPELKYLEAQPRWTSPNIGAINVS
jgi:hypothetical protein